MDRITKILIADDDEVLSTMLSEYLSSEGCDTTWVANGQQALDALGKQSYDIVILDIMMPVLGGIETLKEIRQSLPIPVIMLTARGDDLDRILGLELGADDYVSKPCNPRELLARVKAVLRRSSSFEPLEQRRLLLGDLTMDPDLRKVTLDSDKEIVLTQTEFDLLYMIASTPNKVVSRADMSLGVLDKPLSQWDRSIDVHISNLRKKLGHHVDGSVRIMTLRGSGYIYSYQAES